MAVEGADVAELRSAATQFSKGASALESSTKALHSLISTTTQWRGPDADRFRSQWSGESARTITAAVSALNEAANTLRRNADEQDNASAVNAADTAAAAGVYGGSAASTSTAQLFDRICKDNDGDLDGFHIDRVVGPDGKTRLIAYFEGTGQAPRLTVDRNAKLTDGWVDPYLTSKIDRALSETPDGKITDIMLVGFSQGGMDAQNIAASGRYHVTNLVTYGSPVIQHDNAGIDTVHLQAKGDNVPEMGLFGAAVEAMQNPPVIGIGQAVGEMTNYVSRTSTPSNWIYEADPCIAATDVSIYGVDTGVSVIGNHGDPAYQAVASDFDGSNDPHFANVKKSMEKFDGTVLSAS